MNEMAAMYGVEHGELNDYDDESEYEDYDDEDGIDTDQQLQNELLHSMFGDIYPAANAACDDDLLVELMQRRLFDPTTTPRYEQNKPPDNAQHALSSPQLAFQEFLADGYQRHRENKIVKELHPLNFSGASSPSPSRLSSSALSPTKLNHMLRRFQTLEEHRARKIRVKRNEAESRVVFSKAHNSCITEAHKVICLPLDNRLQLCASYQR